MTAQTVMQPPRCRCNGELMKRLVDMAAYKCPNCGDQVSLLEWKHHLERRGLRKREDAER